LKGPCRMTHNPSRNILSILTCSSCGQDLRNTDNRVECSQCGLEYTYTDSGSLDLRLKEPKMYHLEFELGKPMLSENKLQFKTLKANTNPKVDYSQMRAPRHLTKEIMSYFPKANSSDSLMLDLGCGNGIHKEVCEHAGFQWLGFDYDSSKAPFLGDAHSLPFKNDSFEFVLSIAVLEHIRFPFVMIREVFRVLKPGGKFIGTVAFLEPFHQGSFYHHTHLGIFNSLDFGGFEIEQLAPSEKWSVLMAQASNSLFPAMPTFISKSLVYPLHLLHKLWWHAGSLVTYKLNKQTRIRNTTGAFTFIAVKKGT
jgi:SAM-dependent methyltransferase